MIKLFPAYIGVSFAELVIQTYLLVYATLLMLRRMKLLRRPYSGMDYPEALLAGILLAGVLLISAADGPGVFQATRSYSEQRSSMGMSSFLFFARAFLVVLFFSLLFVILNYINIRLLFRRDLQVANWPVSILLCAIAIGIMIVCWFACREVVDGLTPKLVNFS